VPFDLFLWILNHLDRSHIKVNWPYTVSAKITTPFT
jgi:hypothetical protein